MHLSLEHCGLRTPSLHWIGVLLTVPLLAVAPVRTDEVRVRLFEEAAPRALVVSAEQGLVFLAGAGPDNVLAELAPHQQATIRMRGADLHVTLGETAFYALSLRILPHDGALLDVEVAEGRTPVAPRRYPGRLTVSIDPSDTPTIRLINHVALDAYVACVVAREYGFEDLEGAKAMAVLVRTFVLRAAGTLGDAYDIVDHRLAQQYDGMIPLTDAAREAARQTEGEVLTYHGELVEAVYFSSSGGHTADNDAVWEGRPVPYLRGVSDPYDAASPQARWHTALPRRQLLDALSEQYDLDAEGFYIGERSRDGRVQTVQLIHGDGIAREIPSNGFRLLVNHRFGQNSLKSTLFDVRRTGNAYVFEGRGFGHGVGLNQHGALEMARQGFGYRDILAFYFTDVTVQQRGEATPQPFLKETPAAAANATGKTPRNTPSRRVGW